MMSARSSAKISKALIREDLKRYWELPVLAFILLLFSSISPLFLCGNDDGQDYASVISEILECRYLLNSILLMAVPVISVMLVFSYLNSTGRVLVTHSQPFSRTAMMNSHAVSALILSVVPVIALGIVFLIMAHPVYYSEDRSVNVFGRTDVLKWILQMFLTEIYVLAISIFAAVITGMAIHNLIAILGLNALAPLMSVYVKTILDIMLYGYGYEAGSSEIACTHKLLTFYGDGPTWKSDLIYLAVSIIIFAAAVILYRKRRPERAQEGIVFRSFDIILTILFVFAGAVPAGILFYSIDGRGLAGMIGFAAASLICLLICRMIVLKSLRVLNKKTLKILAVYIVISAVLFGAAALDVFGFEDRLPEDADVVSVSIDIYDESVSAFMYDDPEYYRMGFIDYTGDDAEKARALHRMLLEHKDEWGSYDRGFEVEGMTSSMYEEFGSNTFVRFKYKDTNRNSVFYRSYNVPYSIVLASDEFGELFESDSFKNSIAERIPMSRDVLKVSLMYQGRYTEETIGESVTDQDRLEELRKALAADYSSLDFEAFRRANGKYIGLKLNVTYSFGGNDKGYTDEKFIRVTGAYTHTLKWISDNIGDPRIWLDKSSEYADKAVIYSIGDGRPEISEHDENVWYEEGDPAIENAFMIIDDKALLPALYDVSSGLADVEHTGSRESGIYYIEFLVYNSGWKKTDGGGPYDVMFEGYINKSDLERITEGRADQN